MKGERKRKNLRRQKTDLNADTRFWVVMKSLTNEYCSILERTMGIWDHIWGRLLQLFDLFTDLFIIDTGTSLSV